MAHEQDLSRVTLLLKRSDYEVLTELRHIDTFNRIDAVETACGLDQQINHRAAAFLIA